MNVLLISVIYEHTTSIAGWTKYEMLLLVGTSMLIQRFLMGFFWSSIFEMGRNIRSGHFDFFLAQPGNVLFMASTRKLDPDGLINSFVAMGVVAYAAHKLGLHPAAGDLALYALLVVCGLVIHYSMLVLSISLAFWITSAQGIEGSYFTLSEFSRLPRAGLPGLASLRLRLDPAGGRRQQRPRPDPAARLRAQAGPLALLRRRRRSGSASPSSFSTAA